MNLSFPEAASLGILPKIMLGTLASILLSLKRHLLIIQRQKIYLDYLNNSHQSLLQGKFLLHAQPKYLH
jgi:hypothetical protein